MSGPRARHSLRHKPQSTPLKFEGPTNQMSINGGEVLVYNGSYRLKNGYDRWRGGYLDPSTSGCDASMRAMGDSLYVVSTANYSGSLDYKKEGLGSLWSIQSTRKTHESRARR